MGEKAAGCNRFSTRIYAAKPVRHGRALVMAIPYARRISAARIAFEIKMSPQAKTMRSTQLHGAIWYLWTPVTPLSLFK